MSVLAAGVGRVRRRSRWPSRVERTPWLAIALGATVFQAATGLWGAVVAGRLGLALLHDDLLVFLGLIVAPLLVLAVAGALTAALSLGVTAWKLADADESARVDLAVAGTAGILLGGLVASAGSAMLALAFAVPAALVLVVVLVSDAWRPETGSYLAR